MSDSKRDNLLLKGLIICFLQYNPSDWHWGNLHYGHATSTDLLHWKEEPNCLRHHSLNVGKPIAILAVVILITIK